MNHCPSASPRRFRVVSALVTLLISLVGQTAETNAVPAYEYRDGTPDGIGKWFLGREIAHFMPHHGAPWLERAEREDEERPTQLLAALKLQIGQSVADVGAGSGYFTRRLAQAVGPTGRVYATDIQPEMLQILQTNLLKLGITNVTSILGATTDPKLPTNSVDLILLVDVYHEFDFPYEMASGMVRALKPGGRLVLVEYRGEEKWIPIKPLHKITESQVRQEMDYQALKFLTNHATLPRQHILVFQKPPSTASLDPF